MSTLIQHRANTVELVRKALASGRGIEFDITVWDSELVCGHPNELRRDDFERIPALEFVRAIIEACDTSVALPVAIDVKASIWNSEKNVSEFGLGELDVLVRELPKLIAELRKTAWQITLFSKRRAFFEITHERGTRDGIPIVFIEKSMNQLDAHRLVEMKSLGAIGFHIMIKDNVDRDKLEGLLFALGVLSTRSGLPLATLYVKTTEDHATRVRTIWHAFPKVAIFSDDPELISP